jgi:uncharacterized protein YaiE (UPF0345 family)
VFAQSPDLLAAFLNGTYAAKTPVIYVTRNIEIQGGLEVPKGKRVVVTGDYDLAKEAAAEIAAKNEGVLFARSPAQLSEITLTVNGPLAVLGGGSVELGSGSYGGRLVIGNGGAVNVSPGGKLAINTASQVELKAQTSSLVIYGTLDIVGVLDDDDVVLSAKQTDVPLIYVSAMEKRAAVYAIPDGITNNGVPAPGIAVELGAAAEESSTVVSTPAKVKAAFDVGVNPVIYGGTESLGVIDIATDKTLVIMGRLNQDRALTVESGGSLEIWDGAAVTVGAGGKLIAASGAKLVIAGSATLTAASGGEVDISKLTQVNDDDNNSVPALTLEGTIEVQSGGRLLVPEPASYSTGATIATQIPQIDWSAGGGIVLDSGSTTTFVKSDNNRKTVFIGASGNYTLASGSVELKEGAVVLNGSLTVAKDNSLNDALTVSGGSTLTVPNGVTLEVEDKGTITVNGTVAVNGTITGEGSLVIASGGKVEVAATGDIAVSGIGLADVSKKHALSAKTGVNPAGLSIASAVKDLATQLVTITLKGEAGAVIPYSSSNTSVYYDFFGAVKDLSTVLDAAKAAQGFSAVVITNLVDTTQTGEIKQENQGFNIWKTAVDGGQRHGYDDVYREKDIYTAGGNNYYHAAIGGFDIILWNGAKRKTITLEITQTSGTMREFLIDYRAVTFKDGMSVDTLEDVASMLDDLEVETVVYGGSDGLKGEGGTFEVPEGKTLVITGDITQ